MQESPQIGWDPSYIDYHLPWESRLFVLYLIVVVAMALVRSVSVVRQLWSFARDPLLKSAEKSVHCEFWREFFCVWEACSTKIQSMKQLVVLTFLLSVLVVAYPAMTILIRLGMKEVFMPAALSGEMAEVLMLFTLGILVCTILYAACALFDELLLRQRVSWNRSFAGIKRQSPEGPAC